jgi:zinc transporter, ZIP family
MEFHGKSKRLIHLLWIGAVCIGTISSAIGFIVSSYTEPKVLAIALSFAAVAILVVLGESMIHEAYEQGGASIVGLGIMVGFSLPFILRTI